MTALKLNWNLCGTCCRSVGLLLPSRNITKVQTAVPYNKPLQNITRLQHQVQLHTKTKSLNRFSTTVRHSSYLFTNCSILQKHNLRFRLSYFTHRFHTSPRRQIPPIFWIIIKPVAKLSAIVVGRIARTRIGLRKILLFIFITGTCSMTLYYFSHIEKTPITERRRFLAFTSSQFQMISQAEADMYIEQYKDHLLPGDDVSVERVKRVTLRLLSGSKELKQMAEQKWYIVVVDDPQVKNAFVLPTGHIFIFTGMLNFVDNDNQLAVVLGHEMSHALLSHAAEQLSYAQLIDYLIISAMAAIWTIIPMDGIAIITQWFFNKSIQIMVHLPYSRDLEREADKVGLQLAAKACFDVREGSVFWAKMKLFEQMETMETNDTNSPEWLSSHPLSEKRVEHLDFLLPKAIQVREEAKCPILPTDDPREGIKMLSQWVENQVTARKAGQNLMQVVHAQPQNRAL